MRRFKVLEFLVLGFEDGREQCDAYVEPGDELEFDGSAIWVTWTGTGKKAESITAPNAVELLLQLGRIEEIL